MHENNRPMGTIQVPVNLHLKSKMNLKEIITINHIFVAGTYFYSLLSI